MVLRPLLFRELILSNRREERRVCVPSCRSLNWVRPLNRNVDPRLKRLVVAGLLILSVLTVLVVSNGQHVMDTKKDSDY